MKKSACAQCGIRPHANHSSLCMYCESVNAAYVCAGWPADAPAWAADHAVAVVYPPFGEQS